MSNAVNAGLPCSLTCGPTLSVHFHVAYSCTAAWCLAVSSVVVQAINGAICQEIHE